MSKTAWHRTRSVGGWRFLCLVWLFMAMTGAISVQGESRKAATLERLPVWPEPPETARIAYVREIRRPADLGLKRSTFGKIVNWISGAEKGNEAFEKPFGLGLDEKENLCVTDTGSASVSFYDREARKWHRWQKAGKLGFISPVAVAKRGETLYVADSALGAVVVFSTKGKLIQTITNQLERPVAVALSGKSIAVVDSKKNMVLFYTLEGRFLRGFGKRGAGKGEFNFPTHLTVDRQGNLWVTDSMNSRIQVFAADGEYIKEYGSVGSGFGQFSRPKGIAVDRAGRLYAVDGMFDNIQIFNESGQFLLPVGSGGTGPGQFWLPNGIVMNSQNEIFVADSYNKRLQVLKYVGPP